MKQAFLLAAAATALAGCGGSSAEDILAETSKRMDRIDSATLHLRLVLEPRDGDRSGRAGFALDGPLALGRAGEIPKARLRYTQIAGEQEGRATFIADGSDAFVDTGNGTYSLGAAQGEALKTSAAEVKQGIDLPLGKWIRSASTGGGDRLDGVEVDHVTAELDAVAALRDIFAAADKAGAAVPDLSGTRSETLRKAIDRATLEVWAGRKDKLLRRLQVRLSFQVQVPDSLRGRLGDLVGGRFAFDVDLSRINRPVRVDAPTEIVGELPAPAG